MEESNRSAPSVLRRSLNRARFGAERLILRGLHYRLLLAAMVVVGVAVAAGSLITIFDSDFADLGDSVWWAFLRLTDPGYLGDDEGIARRGISVVVTVLGYLLFLGLLIAILTQWLQDVISKLESGVTPVAVRNHIVLLGWTHQTPTIVGALLRTRSRAKRFLERHGARELRIVILAERVDNELRHELRERLGSSWDDRRVLLRSGSPLRLDHLERVAFRDAAVVILPGADFGDREPEAVDEQMVKTLLSICRNASRSGSPPPLAVAELYDPRRKGVARRAYGGEIEVVAAEEILSRLITQSIRQPGICDVFLELLSLHEGNAIYVRQLEHQAGTRFRDHRGTFPRAIPIGFMRPGDARPALNPDPNTVLEDEDLLVFVARSFEDCIVQTGRVDSPDPDTRPPSPATESRHRALILGWSRLVPSLVAEFARYGNDVFEVDIVSPIPIEDRERLLSFDEVAAMGGRVRQIEAGCTSPGALARLEPQGYDNIILLASERFDEEEHADAATICSYLALCELMPEDDPRPEIFVELLDEENQRLFAGDRVDVVVSPALVSYLISQVSLRREIAAVFGELFRPWGVQVGLRPVEDYLSTDAPADFEELDLAAEARDEIALGFYRKQGPEIGLVLNPDREDKRTLLPGDQVVVLSLSEDPNDRS